MYPPGYESEQNNQINRYKSILAEENLVSVRALIEHVFLGKFI